MVKIMVTLFSFSIFFLGGVTYLLHHFYYEFSNLVGPLGPDQDHPTLRLQQWQPQCYQCYQPPIPCEIGDDLGYELCHIIY